MSSLTIFNGAYLEPRKHPPLSNWRKIVPWSVLQTCKIFLKLISGINMKKDFVRVEPLFEIAVFAIYVSLSGALVLVCIAWTMPSYSIRISIKDLIWRFILIAKTFYWYCCWMFKNISGIRVKIEKIMPSSITFHAYYLELWKKPFLRNCIENVS